MQIRVLLADDHQMVRQGLKSLIEKEPDLEVVGEAENGRSTLSAASELTPHVVVMDVAMPDLNGIEATRLLLKETTKLKVVGLSGHARKQYVSEMLKAGASAYLLKDSAAEELVRAIRTVMTGKTYLSPDIAKGVVDQYVHTATSLGENPALVSLTNREREVLQLIAEGKSTKEIAHLLAVSIKTIETHRRNIMEKLDIHSVAELTKYAVREGLTSLDH
jgi:DNA-binding NarL/FixJ family response regulator